MQRVRFVTLARFYTPCLAADVAIVLCDCAVFKMILKAHPDAGTVLVQALASKDCESSLAFRLGGTVGEPLVVFGEGAPVTRPKAAPKPTPDPVEIQMLEGLQNVTEPKWLRASDAQKEMKEAAPRKSSDARRKTIRASKDTVVAARSSDEGDSQECR